MLSAIIFLHPLSMPQWLASALVFAALYYKAFAGESKPHGGAAPEGSANGAAAKDPLLPTEGEKDEELVMVAVEGAGSQSSPAR
jgi:hypothetical protein